MKYIKKMRLVNKIVNAQNLVEESVQVKYKAIKTGCRVLPRHFEHIHKIILSELPHELSELLHKSVTKILSIIIQGYAFLRRAINRVSKATKAGFFQGPTP